MAALEALDALLASASRACCSPLAIFIQIQGCIICLTLALGWACAAYVRNKVTRRMKLNIVNGNSFAFICEDVNDLEHSAQITSLYGGPLEFLFIVESTDDPAYHAVSLLISDFQVGVERMHKESKYVLFLDDDVRLHPGSIGALTSEMEKNPEIFIQTGYPLDLPSGNLGSYCIYEYHMPCSMGFATGGRTFFLWGGCMMMHAEDFRKDLYGVVSGLRDGGYSDDMTLAAIAGQHKRLIWSPPVAVFPHPLARDLSFSRYWNYLRKQTFVLESYISRVFLAMLVDNFLYPISAIRSHFSQSINWSGVRYHLKNGKIRKVTPTDISFHPLLKTYPTKAKRTQFTYYLDNDEYLLPLVNTKGCRWVLVDVIDCAAFVVDRIISNNLIVERKHTIERSMGNGPTYSDLAWKHLYGKKQFTPKSSFLSSLSRSISLTWRLSETPSPPAASPLYVPSVASEFALHLARNAVLAFCTFSSLPAHALSVLCCRARPNEKDSDHGFFPFSLFIAFRFRVASSSLCPPERKTIAGTAAGTVLWRARTVCSAITSGATFADSDPGVTMFGFNRDPSRRTCWSFSAL
ncbi:Glycosyl transferase family 2 [Musa troglodytarum]|uniref:ceramide glucosyltransferase n=1 Tax=Musa troglodytarum TaxID=320322 RepID=A0A9E7HD94_9LILI|nr:Glycosyl transferase family 2 [Musa troglodytarum]